MQKTNPEAAGTTAAGEPGQGGPTNRRAWPPPRTLATWLIGATGPLAAVAIGGYIYLSSGRVVTTDNAYVKADKIAVSSDVAGRIVEVVVAADQTVKRGDLLFRLDAEPFRIALERAEARLAATAQEIDALRALYEQKAARVQLAQGDLAYQHQQHDRQQHLTKSGVGSRSLMDTAEKNLRNARDQALIGEKELAEVRAKLGGDPARPTAEHPSVREARAQRDAAALDLKRTEVRAPVAGTITNFDLQPGTYVGVGSVVFSMIGSENIWVQANYKETELTYVRAGQTAHIHVDTYPDRGWQGRVTSISPATGAEFALLPPQNATGNWVKVVQRLPVRLALESAAGAPPLRAGMSVVVEIDTGHRRALPGFLAGLFGTAKASE